MITQYLYLQATLNIEKAHSEDAVRDMENNQSFPAELIYSNRMLEILNLVEPQNSYILKLAAQCQHLRRWGVSRTKYPMDRVGYHQWRREVMDFQLKQAQEILADIALDIEDIEIVLNMLKNQGNKSNPASQIIEDTACLVFVKWYLEPFTAKHEATKVADILKKTTRKMSEKGLSLIPSIGLTSGTLKILKMLE